MPHTARRRATGLLVVVGALTGCSAAVTVPPAPDAAHPACAEVVLALPARLGDLERLESGTQAAAMWGERTDPVVLRCGVAPPGPTTEQCVQADDGSVSVDWIAVPSDERPDGTADWVFTTYGRTPAVEVQVPASVTSSRSTSFLVDVGRAVSLVEQERACL